jgi:hypothetical protein
LITNLLAEKKITKEAYLPMLTKEREKNGIPLSYRAYRYLNEGKLGLKAPKLARVAKMLNVEIQPETIYFVKTLDKKAQ